MTQPIDINDALAAASLGSVGKPTNDGICFLRTFHTRENMFLLPEESIALLKRHANEGSPYAQFAYGRWLACTRYEEDAKARAVQLFEKAYAKGLADAGAALSVAWHDGDMGIVDRAKEKQLLEEALERNSEYAALLQIGYLIYGWHQDNGNPGKAIECIGQLMAYQQERGIAPNGIWYYYRACATELLSGRKAARADYEQAARMGIIKAWSGAALCVGYGDSSETITDYDGFNACIDKGCEMQDALCLCFKATYEIDKHWDNLPESQKKMHTAKLFRALEEAYRLGCPIAAELLGDIYYYGLYDLPEDNHKAWQWYAKAAIWDSTTAYERMFDMAQERHIGTTLPFRDMLALRGARLGSAKLLGETVAAYGEGRLTEFAGEIEQYYIPLFAHEEDEGEPAPDDGRQYGAQV